MSHTFLKKFLSASTAFFFFFFSVSPASAFNVSVTAGSATVSNSGNTTTINVKSNAVLQGNTSIAANQVVDIIGSSNTLLRDTTGLQTNWLGTLLAQGNVVLINTNGIYIAKSANINVQSLIASTLDIQNEAFLTGQYKFQKVNGVNVAQVLNEANITVKDGGYVVFMADRVVNGGTITAYLGSVAFGSGQNITVNFDQGGLVNLVVNKGLAQQLTNSQGETVDQIVNKGTIKADGGRIQLTAKLLETTLKSIVNNSGIIEANSAVNQKGVIELVADGGIENSGTISGSQLNESGYTFESTGVLDVGHGYFDNLDKAIDISGDISGTYSDVDNVNFIGDVTLTGDTTLQADAIGTNSGEVVMNGFSLTGGNYNLTLDASYSGDSNIDTLDGSITGVNLLTLNSSSGTPETFLSTGTTFSVNTLQTNYGTIFSRSQGSGTAIDPYMIYSVSNAVGGLQYIPTESLSAYYELANNINAAETTSWNAGAGFIPIGNYLSNIPFTGTFNGNSYTISNLFINLPSTNGVGLFGETSGATIENVGLVNAIIMGQNLVGSLVGSNGSSNITNSYATGSVSGSAEDVGGLVGYNWAHSSIVDSYATSNVSGSSDSVGGLVGFNSLSSIDNSYATGNVSSGSGWIVGGLVGYNLFSSIDNSYATGSVSGNFYYVGGLVGSNGDSSITNSYATGSVSGEGIVGGLVGSNYNSSSISNSYATGSVSGSFNVGGLVGYNNLLASIDNSYATGSVSGSSKVGGLVGYNYTNSTISNSYATGVATSSGDTAGGLIGNDDGTNTLTNNWWYNATNSVGVGNSSPLGVNKAGAVSDFFSTATVGSSTGNAVYWVSGDVGGALVWDMSPSLGHVWAMSGDDDAYPLLQFRYSTTITDDIQLQLMFLNLGASYSLANNIDATETLNWNNGAGFAPIGSSGTPFTGNFNGNNYTISNLFIDRPSTADVGLFGFTSGSTIENVGLLNVNITGEIDVGSLAGTNYYSGSIDNAYATGSVGGLFDVGGLVGRNYKSSSIDNSYASVSVSGSSADIGGLVGYNKSSSIDNSYATGNISGNGVFAGGLVGENYNSSSIDNSYATGSVSGKDYLGGLVGYNWSSSTIDNSYATGSVSGSNDSSMIGGLVGSNSSSSITNSYATGSVSGYSWVGGLVGWNFISGRIDNSYAIGSVSGHSQVGGLVGYNGYSSVIDNAYATGSVTGQSQVGGLVGYNYTNSTISNSYATGVAISSGDTAGGLIGNDDGTNTLTNNWWYNATNFVGVGNSSPLGVNKAGAVSDFFSTSQAVYNGSTPWDFSNIWLATGSYPQFRWAYDIWTGSGDWSVPSNWSKDVVPTANTNVAFAGDSTSNSTIDTGFGGDIANLVIFPNYTGTISQDTNLTISGNYIQNAGSFVSDPEPFSVGNNFSLLGGTFNRFTGTGLSGDPYVIYDVYGLQGVSGFLGAYFSLNNNVDASVASSWNSGAGFTPIGNNATPFTGTFNGNSYTISNLFINLPTTNDIGLFGATSGATIENVGLINADITGKGNVGGLVGYSNNSSSIANSYATGSVSGSAYNVGGLVGFNNSSSIDNSYATGGVNGANYVGGLVGYSNYSSRIDNSYATGSVNGSYSVGGLVGLNNFSSSIDKSYATGSVIASGKSIGGLVGGNANSSSITDSYATGSVSGGSNTGGLIGGNYSSAIDNSYATGSVSGGSNAGGLIGGNYNSTIDNSFATGGVSGTGNVGGLVGGNFLSKIANSFATGGVSGSGNVGGLVGHNDNLSTITNSYYTDANHQNGLGIFESGGPSSFFSTSNPVYNGDTPWDFTNIWLATGITYPDLLFSYDIWSGSGNWSDAANWSKDIVPTSISKVLFNATSLDDSTIDAFGGDIASLVITSGYTGNITQSNDLSISGSYIQSGGTFNQNANLSIGGSYTSTGGTFNAGSQPITFTGSGTITSGSTLFNNLNISTTGTYIVTDGITTTGNFTQTSGIFVTDPTQTTFSVGGSFSLQGGEFNRFTGSGTGNDPYLIYDVYGLQGMGGFLSSTFGLANGIDATVTSNWNSGAGFTPIGNSSTPFTGTFNGNNYTISNLFIDLPTTNGVGLFGETSGATIENVGLVNDNITGQNGVGGLVGYNNNSSKIDNSYATGNISGSSYVGGLVGLNTNLSSIDNSYVTGSVSGSGLEVGGFVGGNFYSSSITNSYATGSVSGFGNVGGLVGSNFLSSIDNSNTTGNVSGVISIGGLVGYNRRYGSIDNSYATGSVSGSDNQVGGLVGTTSSASINNSYATGSVSGTTWVGGLVGFDYSSSIDNSYATGSVSGSGTQVGGLVGSSNSSNIENSYATGNVSGSSKVGGLVGHNYNYSTIDNSYATGVAASSGDTAGGLIGNDDGTNTLTNNWWFNATNTVGVGNSSPSGVTEATAASDFYGTGSGTGGAVYSTWDFNGLWVSNASAYPHLIWQDMGDGSAFIGGTSLHPFQISDVNELQFMSYDLSSYFKLTGDIDASVTLSWNSGAGFTPIGNSSAPFTGTFNGNSYTISDLFINLPLTNDVGLFGYTSNGATIENVGLVNANITGQNNVGGLVGENYSSSISLTAILQAV